MSTYSILLKILDKIREDAPADFKSYKPEINDTEKINQARAKAFIHLFLLASMGVLDFKKREIYVTDGTYDGGIDAYYIQENTKTIYFIQSKFRISESNFEEKNIDITEILKMDVDRILDGENSHENGISYNTKILEMQAKIKSIPDIGRYRYEVILLANLHKNITQSKLKLLTSGIPSIVFNYKKTYSDLIFPIITGTFYNFSDLHMSINLTNKSSGAKTDYSVETELGICNITVLFAPLSEIGKLMYEYKNSILKYNPRSYLSLKEGSINDEIRNTILTKNTNEFALFNNGITILSDETFFNEKIGEKDKAKLSLKNPQIINGGQTAFTLSLIYEEGLGEYKSFSQKLENKEVLIKIITFSLLEDIPTDKKLALIESISEATNKQNQVNSADRSSNNPILIESQKRLFTDFGFLLERKRGEFFDGLRHGFIEKDHVIDRAVFMRIANACLDSPFPSRKESKLLSNEKIDLVLNDKNNFRKYFFGCLCYSHISSLPDQSEFGESKRAGIFALIAVCVNIFFDEALSDDELKSLAIISVENMIHKWILFEEYASNQLYNSDYFIYNFNFATNSTKTVSNYKKYYSSPYVLVDMNNFFTELKLPFKEIEFIRVRLNTVERYMRINYLTPEIIANVKPLINSNHWFDQATIINIANTLSIDPRTVSQAIKAITSKEIGYYFRPFYN
jgi:hypothetical protein